MATIIAVLMVTGLFKIVSSEVTHSRLSRDVYDEFHSHTETYIAGIYRGLERFSTFLSPCTIGYTMNLAQFSIVWH